MDPDPDPKMKPRSDPDPIRKRCPDLDPKNNFVKSTIHLAIFIKENKEKIV